MKKKQFNMGLIAYEMRNIIGNPFAIFFGLFFPMMMLMVITKAMDGEVPASAYPTACTGVFIGMSMIVPMAIIFLGYAATYSQELEKDIPIRMSLFGFTQKITMTAKVVAQAIVLTVALFIYITFGYLTVDVLTPDLMPALGFILCQYLMGIMFFGIAHGVASIFKKFGPTYCIMMILYFGIMILCGMMGVQTTQLPKFLQSIAHILPMYYIGKDFADIWQGGSYNVVPLLQSFLFLGAVAGIVLMLSLQKNKRTIK